MVDNQNEDTLTAVLKATSDTTRRALLTQLVQEGSTRVTDLAKAYDMSLNAVSKHIKILEKAGLIRRQQKGRTHWIEANMEPAKLVEQWFAQMKSIWAMRLDKLEQILTSGDKDNE